MRKSKIYKILGVLILLVGIGGGIWYWQLPNRHKAIVKSFLFEKLGVVNPNWKVENKSRYKTNPTLFHLNHDISF